MKKKKSQKKRNIKTAKSAPLPKKKAVAKKKEAAKSAKKPAKIKVKPKTKKAKPKIKQRKFSLKSFIPGDEPYQEDRCIICLDGEGFLQRWAEAPCDCIHWWHRECLEEYLYMMGAECPTCKADHSEEGFALPPEDRDNMVDRWAEFAAPIVFNREELRERLTRMQVETTSKKVTTVFLILYFSLLLSIITFVIGVVVMMMVFRDWFFGELPADGGEAANFRSRSSQTQTPEMMAPAAITTTSPIPLLDTPINLIPPT